MSIVPTQTLTGARIGAPRSFALPVLSMRPAIRAVILPLGLAALFGPAIWLCLPFPAEARIALIVFCLATIAWCLSGIDDTLIALAAAGALVATRTVPAQQLHGALGSELIWLLIGAFIIAAALRACGLAERLALSALGRVRTVRGLFLAVTGVIIATAFVVPSTSGRAALLLPVYLALAAAIDDARINRALALLFPTVILLSAGGSLIGAGAHLIAVEMIVRSGGTAYGYLGWMAMALPLAVLASLAALAIILRLFLEPAERRRPLLLPAPPAGPPSRQQLYVGAVVGLVVLGWSTQGLHGVDAAVVTLLGAVAVTLKPLAPVSMKQAAKTVEWQLILFLAATTLMGSALIATGAAKALMQLLLAALPTGTLASPATVAALVAAVALLSHLLITSRSARATILIPLLALPLVAHGYDAGALIVLIVMGTGFCQTLAVSAKPVALYADLDRPTYAAGDLMRLSLALLPVMFALLMLFSLWLWPFFGLALR